MIYIFAHSRARIRRAKKHILEFEREVRSFINNEPYDTVVEQDFSGNYLTKIKFTEHGIYDLAAIATDAVDNLRATLDYAWHALAVASGAKSLRDKATFPFKDNLLDFDNMIARGLKKFPPDIVSLLRTFQPYKGGDNDLLWALHRISATNRHLMLAPIVLGLGRIKGTIKSTGQMIPPPQRWDGSKNEIVLFAIATNGRTPLTYHDINIPIEIVFDAVEIVGGERALAILNDMAGEVEDILEAIEGAARMLGFTP